MADFAYKTLCALNIGFIIELIYAYKYREVLISSKLYTLLLYTIYGVLGVAFILIAFYIMYQILVYFLKFVNYLIKCVTSLWIGEADFLASIQEGRFRMPPAALLTILSSLSLIGYVYCTYYVYGENLRDVLKLKQFYQLLIIGTFLITVSSMAIFRQRQPHSSLPKWNILWDFDG